MAIIYRCYYKNKSYIGATTRSLGVRINEHRSHSKSKTNRLYLIMNEIGFDKFKFEEIETVENEVMFNREKYWINKFDSYKSGYNESIGGQGANKMKHSKESVAKRIATRQRLYGKDFVVYCKKTGEFLGKFRNKKECSLEIGYDDSAIGKILKGTRGSNRIIARYVEV